jgi:hypothetical protein
VNIAELLKYKPYSYKVHRRGTFVGTIMMFTGRVYSILYEDTQIRTFRGDITELKDMVFLLNAAYHSGFMNGYSHAELEKSNG